MTEVLESYIVYHNKSVKDIEKILKENKEIDESLLFTYGVSTLANCMLPNYKCVFSEESIKFFKVFALMEHIEKNRNFDDTYNELIDKALDVYNSVLKELEINRKDVEDHKDQINLNLDYVRVHNEFNLRKNNILQLSETNNYELVSIAS
ncbi:MAG: hypothetical protein ACE364_09360 [Chlorobiota bacterium]